MRAVILALTIATTGLMAGYSGAQAQNKPMDGGSTVGPAVGDYEPKPLGARVYGYYQQGPAPSIQPERQQGPGGCGVYFYWDGERCADARNKTL